MRRERKTACSPPRPFGQRAHRLKDSPSLGPKLLFRIRRSRYSIRTMWLMPGLLLAAVALPAGAVQHERAGAHKKRGSVPGGRIHGAFSIPDAAAPLELSTVV